MSSDFETSSSGISNLELYDKEPVYQAEKIIGSKREKGDIYYLVKWKGFEKSDASWEKSSTVSSRLIKEYNERVERKKKKLSAKDSDSKKESKNSDLKKKSKDSDSKKESSSSSSKIKPKSIIDSYLKFKENGEYKIYYIVLMSDSTEVKYSSKKVKKEIPELGILFLENFPNVKRQIIPRK